MDAEAQAGVARKNQKADDASSKARCKGGEGESAACWGEGEV